MALLLFRDSSGIQMFNLKNKTKTKTKQRYTYFSTFIYYPLITYISLRGL